MTRSILPSTAGRAAAPAADITLRPFDGIKDHDQCVELQGRIWGAPNAVASSMTLAVQRHGGVAIGAFDRQGRLLGFVFSFLAPARFPGARRGLSHHSHMAGVAPEWQNRGLGTALKLAQREAVLAQGLNLITWTYDPLEARNARMNIHKLGAICRTYCREYYGEMRDTLNAGVASDRFEVEWWLEPPEESSPPERSLDADAATPGQEVIAAAPRAAAAASAVSTRLRDARPAGRLEINIPADFQAMKRKDINLARAWRMRTRLQFEDAFSKGFVVTDFAILADRTCYILT